MDPIPQLIFVFQSGGIPLGVPPQGGGGPGCFPLASWISLSFRPSMRSVAISQDLSTMVDKTVSNRVHRYDH
jgi:hypothetical protein